MWWGDNSYCTCTFLPVIYNIHRWVFILVYLWSSMLTSDVASNGDTCSSMSSRSCSNSESCSDKSSHFSSSCSCIYIQLQNDQEPLSDQSEYLITCMYEDKDLIRDRFRHSTHYHKKLIKHLNLFAAHKGSIKPTTLRWLWVNILTSVSFGSSGGALAGVFFFLRIAFFFFFCTSTLPWEPHHFSIALMYRCVVSTKSFAYNLQKER